MNIHFSISLKLTIIVVAVSAAVIFSLTLYNINEQAISFENIYVDKAKDYASIFDISYFSDENHLDVNQSLTFFKENNSDISQIDVFNKKNDTLSVVYSSNSSSINENKFNEFINYSIDHQVQIKIHQDQNNEQELIVITPLNTTLNSSGAYFILFSIEDSIKAFETKTNNLLLISALSLFILIFSFLFLLRKTIVYPIIQFRDSARQFGKGTFETRVKIRSKDEIGELAEAFNTMAHDLKISRDKVEEYNKILERLLDQKDAFIGQLGHDLKNPLQSLVGLLPIIIEQEESPEIKEHLKILNQDTKYMKDLIFKTLELAKLRSEKIEFNFSTINLYELVHEIYISQQIFLKKYHILLHIAIPKNIKVYADKLRLEEIIINLISNAVNYTKDERGSITISAKEDNDEVLISIKDTGIGMTKDQLSKIFDEFYRAASTTKDMKSMGLGLSICKKIVEQHHGKIWAESEGKDKGSTFYFTLPKEKNNKEHPNNNLETGG